MEREHGESLTPGTRHPRQDPHGTGEGPRRSCRCIVTYHRPDPRHLVLTMPGLHARSRTVRDQETALPACDRRPARQVSS